MLKNVDLTSVAAAVASNVLPVPGGPNISTPRQGWRMPDEGREGKGEVEEKEKERVIKNLPRLSVYSRYASL